MNLSETPRTTDPNDVLEQLAFYQAMMHKQHLSMNIIQWEGIKSLYTPNSHFTQLREVVKTIPKFWYFVMKNSGYFDILFINQNDEIILHHLIDVNIDSMTQKLDGKSVIDVMYSSFRIVYSFSENEYLESKEISQTVYFSTETKNPIKYVNSEIKFKKGFDVHIVHDHYKHSFFDQFIIPFENLNEDERDDSLANLHILIFDLIKNPVHFFKGSMIQFAPEQDEILRNLEVEEEMNNRRLRAIEEEQQRTNEKNEKSKEKEEIQESKSEESKEVKESKEQDNTSNSEK